MYNRVLHLERALSNLCRRNLFCTCHRLQSPTWKHNSSNLKIDCKTYPSPRYSSPQQETDIKVLYRWPTMKHFRFISRFKIYQVSAMLLLLPPMARMYLKGDIAGDSMTYASIAALGTTTILFILSHYFRRLIGEIAHVSSTGHLKLSTLTFFGGRRDVYFKVADVVPFADSQLRVGGAIQRLEVKNHPEVFLYSLKFGRVMDSELLQKYLQIN